MFKKKNKAMTAEQLEIAETKDYFDRVIPGAVRFFTDHYICGNFYKSVWVITPLKGQPFMIDEFPHSFAEVKDFCCPKAIC